MAEVNKIPVGPVAVDFLKQLQSQAKAFGVPVGASPTMAERDKLQQAIDRIGVLIELQQAILQQQQQRPPMPVRVQVQQPAADRARS
jgi:hypothetical protein